MDDRRFDRLARATAGGVSRRGMLKILGGGVAGAAAGLFGKSRGTSATHCGPCGFHGPFGTCFPVQNGTPCNLDGNPCTRDTCQNGSCRPGPPVVCPPSDQCRTFACSPATGTCFQTNRPNGTACNADNNACTVGDACQNGVCRPGAPLDCSALDSACARGVCDPVTGACAAEPINEGLACDDGDACTQTDTCQAGACVGSNPVDCVAQDQCHVAGVCDPLTGTCSNPAAADGTPCNADDNACTAGDTCQGGACVAGPAVVCPAPPDACHAIGTCDPLTGDCSEPTLVVGTCKSGRIKDGPCDCDGTCCTPGNNCVGKPGERRCQQH
jgi:hypothetical protein